MKKRKALEKIQNDYPEKLLGKFAGKAVEIFKNRFGQFRLKKSRFVLENSILKI